MKKSQISVRKTKFFFLGKLYKIFFLLYTFITLVIIHTKCGSHWTAPWPDKNSIFLKIEKSKKSIFQIEIRTFFLEKLGGPFFFLRVYLPRGYSIPSLVWFEQLLDPIKRPIFKITYLKKSQISVQNTNFFLVKLYKKLLLLYTFITQVIIHTKCGSLWTTPWPDKNSIILKIKKIEKVDISDWNTNFFLEKLGGSFFLSQSLPTLGILHTKFGLIWRTSWPNKRTYF